jgi:MFS family permease
MRVSVAEVSKRNLIFSVYLPGLCLSFCRGLLLPILPLYVRSFDASYSVVGVVLAAESVGTLVSDVPAGILLRKLGQKPVMLLGLGLAVLGTSALAFADTLLQVFLFHLVSGVGAALWHTSRHAYLAEVVPLGLLGRANSIMGGIGRMGSFFGPVLGGLVASGYGLRAPFLVCGAVGAVALIVVALWVTRGGTSADRRPSPPLWALLKDHSRVLATAGTGQVFAQLIRTARGVIIPLYAADVIGLDLKSVGLIMSLAALLDMSLFYPAGLLMDRVGRKYASVPCFLIQGVGMALIPLSSGFGSLLAAALVIGLGNGIGAGTMMTLGADLAPSNARGEFLGVWRFIGDGGHAAGSLAVGSLGDLLGITAAPFVIAGVGVLAASIFGLLVPETLVKSKRAGVPRDGI